MQVFIAEQLLYTSKDLARHQQTGDIEGVMAESGFKGHPSCRLSFFPSFFNPEAKTRSKDHTLNTAPDRVPSLHMAIFIKFFLLGECTSKSSMLILRKQGMKGRCCTEACHMTYICNRCRQLQRVRKEVLQTEVLFHVNTCGNVLYRILKVLLHLWGHAESHSLNIFREAHPRLMNGVLDSLVHQISDMDISRRELILYAYDLKVYRCLTAISLVNQANGWWLFDDSADYYL